MNDFWDQASYLPNIKDHISEKTYWDSAIYILLSGVDSNSSDYLFVHSMFLC
jgi:hypothetical protein